MKQEDAPKGFLARGRQWPLLVFAILATSVGGQLTMLVVATSDESFVVEKDYYDEALRWDETQEARRRSAVLGWKLLPFVDWVEGAGQLTLRLAVLDDRGQPVSGADVRVRAFAVARSGQVASLGLEELKPGTYGGELAHGRAGLWELEVEVARGAERFVATERIEAR